MAFELLTLPFWLKCHSLQLDLRLIDCNFIFHLRLFSPVREQCGGSGIFYQPFIRMKGMIISELHFYQIKPLQLWHHFTYTNSFIILKYISTGPSFGGRAPYICVPQWGPVHEQGQTDDPGARQRCGEGRTVGAQVLLIIVLFRTGRWEHYTHFWAKCHTSPNYFSKI